MRERPILFSDPMVRAIMAGTKTQTRRVARGYNFVSAGGALLKFTDDDIKEVACPYGQPGDRLWVRETHAPQPDCSLAWERWMNGHGGEKPIIHYAADKSERAWVDKWRPSIHMPRWASRITLEVTGVRVERLQDISEADAIAEGLTERNGLYATPDNVWQIDPRKAYRDLWEQINGPESWAANPWVWCVSFRRLEAAC